MSNPSNIHEPAELDHRQQPTTVDLPVEILSEIFIQCTGVDVHERMGNDSGWYLPMRDWGKSWHSSPRDGNSEFSPEASLLPITHVCQHWRFAAISTPRLWARLPPIGTCDFLSESGMDNLIRMHLARSGKAPLFVFILYQDDVRDDYTAALLSPHLHRVEKLKIMYTTKFGSKPIPFDRLFVDLQGRFELLTDLHINHTDGPRPLQRFNGFEHAPLLRNVFGQPQGLALPWSQIKRYCGQFRYAVEVCDILHQCAQLELLSLSFHFWQMYPEDRAYPPAAPMVFPHLLELRITDKIGTVDQLIPLLHAPLLEVVQISEVSRGLPIPQNLITCLTQSQCTGLTSLQLLCSSVDVGELRRLAELAPGLRELDAYLTSDAFRGLKYSSVTPNIFPRLVRLIIHRVCMDEDVLIEILQSRITPSLYGGLEGCQVERLQYCQIYPPGDREDSVEALRRIQSAVELLREVIAGSLEIIDGDSHGASLTIKDIYWLGRMQPRAWSGTFKKMNMAGLAP
ncbi:hypothetical protein BD779DRAFT_1473275 [Infundibulicybe gibba]|nr:hypothetical protein BD779DRAFT_1473275 [Infundibulicybe gibba]